MPYAIIAPNSLIFFLFCMFIGSVKTNAEIDNLFGDFGDIESVTIATSREQPIQTAPVIASVFTAKDIKNSGARNLAEILNQVPGFYIGTNYNLFDPIYSVRGFSSAFNQNLLVMIDDIPQRELLFGDWSYIVGTIPMDAIERVEVIRGPGSALYGSDAFVGAVNIITKKKVPKDTTSTLSAGSYNTKNGRFITGTKLGEMNLVASLEYFKSDGHEPLIQVDQQTILDGIMSTSASLAPSNAATGRDEIGIHINLTNKHSQFGLRGYKWNNKGLGVGSAASLDPFGNIDNQGFEATYKYDREVVKNLNISSTFDYTSNRYALDNIHFFPPGAFGVFTEGVISDGELEQQFTRLRFDLSFSGYQRHFFNFGSGGEFSYIKTRRESRNYSIINGNIIPIGPVQNTANDPILDGFKVSRDLWFMYIQDEWNLHPDWILTYGARYDHYSDYGATISPRAVLVWNMQHNLTTKLLYGRGFRSPTILETKAKNIPAIESNPNLDAEMINTIDLAVDYQARYDLLIRANVFYHKTDKQIRQQNTGGPVFRPENVGDQEGQGIELEAWWSITPKAKVFANYAYQKNTDKTTNKDAGFSPHQKMFSGLQYTHRNLFFSARALYIGSRDRVAEDTRPDADKYAIIDLLIRADLYSNIEASLDVRNIFDRQVEDAGFGTAFPGDMPLPGRNYYVTIAAKF